jgi:hypothetical protein
MVAPSYRATVELPVVVRWALRRGKSIPNLGSFVVVVDGSPPPPGHGLTYFVRTDPDCSGQLLRSCLAPTALAKRGVYQTRQHQLLLTTIAELPDERSARRSRHEVTIAYLDGYGRRMSESAFTTVFYLDRGGPSA